MEIKKTFRKAAFKSRIWLIKAWEKTKENTIFIGRKTGKAIKKVAFFVKKTLLALTKGLGLILDDLLLLAGIASVFYGVFQIYEPAGYIILGLCLSGLAYLVAHKRVTDRR
jgi:hypothetical protein